MTSVPPWLQDRPPAVVAAPPTAAAAVVTPPAGPASQEPPKPVVLQNALVGAGTTAMTNILTSGVTGDTDVVQLAAGLNAIAQGVKQFTWFDEKRWTIWLLIFVGIALACWVYRDPNHWDLTKFWMPGYFEIPTKGVLNGLTAAFQALSNFHGLLATGVSPLTPTPPERSVEAKTHG